MLDADLNPNLSDSGLASYIPNANQVILLFYGCLCCELMFTRILSKPCCQWFGRGCVALFLLLLFFYIFLGTAHSHFLISEVIVLSLNSDYSVDVAMYIMTMTIGGTGKESEWLNI